MLSHFDFLAVIASRQLFMSSSFLFLRKYYCDIFKKKTPTLQI